MAKLTQYQYRRQVFQAALLESLGRLQLEILNDGRCGTDNCSEADVNLMKKFSDAFYKEELKLETSTIAQVKTRLSEASEFIRDVADACEDIAEDKADAVKTGEIEPEDGQEIELSDEDKAVLNQIFDVKKPVEEIEAIRDATVAALIAEDKKAQEVRNALDIAQSQVSTGENPQALEETVKRINKIGPTSLMNAVMNHFSTLAIKDINENGTFTSVSDAMSKNRDIIKTRAVMMYTLFEAANVFKIKVFTPAEVKNLTYELYYGK
ncbi:MAG: hypothetical protein NC489_07945 [Ruminococcus flavefaciens]|nr:hypothetical protein [Ruminococcus flavefaciens]